MVTIVILMESKITWEWPSCVPGGIIPLTLTVVGKSHRNCEWEHPQSLGESWLNACIHCSMAWLWVEWDQLCQFSTTMTFLHDSLNMTQNKLSFSCFCLCLCLCFCFSGILFFETVSLYAVLATLKLFMWTRRDLNSQRTPFSALWVLGLKVWTPHVQSYVPFDSFLLQQ